MERRKITNECRYVNCRSIDGDFCITYINPEYWWKKGRCPIPSISREERETLKINPLKASRRRSQGGLILGYKLRKYPHSKKYNEGTSKI